MHVELGKVYSSLFDMELFHCYSNPLKMAIKVKTRKRPRFETHVLCENLIICEFLVLSSPGYCVVFIITSRNIFLELH